VYQTLITALGFIYPRHVEGETMAPLLALLLVLLCAVSNTSLTTAQGLPFGDMPGRLPNFFKDVGKGPSAPRHAPLMDPQTQGAAPRRERLDINSASLEKLQALPGIAAIAAQHIIDGRPYRGTATWW
jgi:DNA uptake protein ComE-like DNA-binding protein